MTDEIQSNLEALSEDEGLTDNLTDEPARALLNWAAQQIQAGLDLPSVRRAVRAANRDEIASPEAAVAAASAALGAGGSAAAATPPAQPPAAQPPAAQPPALDAAVQSGIAAGMDHAQANAPSAAKAAPAGIFNAALAAVRQIGAQGRAATPPAAAPPAAAGRGRRPKHQARRSRKSRFSTRRP